MDMLGVFSGWTIIAVNRLKNLDVGNPQNKKEKIMATKSQRITGWVLTALVGLFMIGASGLPKFFDFPGKEDMMNKLGIPLPLLPTIGVLEIAVTLIYLIPRTALLGAILMTGYLGGAIFTHLRVGDPWFFPIIIGVIAWLGLGLRNPWLLRQLAGIKNADPMP
jgi:hypothetical protein